MPVGEIELEARKRFDHPRKVADDERQSQVTSIRTSLEIPAFNPNKNKKEKERERRERREREEHERREAETRREAREKKERERRDRDERERERRDRDWDDRESRRPSKDTDAARQDSAHRLVSEGISAGIDTAALLEAHRSTGSTSLQKFTEEENCIGEIGHLPNLRMSVPATS